MGVSPTGCCDGRGGINGGGDLSILPPEHSCTVYCNQAHYGPVSSREAQKGVKGGHAVVVEGQIGIGGDTDSGWRDGKNGGRGGDGQDRDRVETCVMMFQQT